MDSPDLHTILQQVRQALGSQKSPIGNAYRFNFKDYTIFALVTDIDAEKGNFSLAYIKINNTMKDDAGIRKSGIFFDSIMYENSATSGNLRKRFSISRVGEIYCPAADSSEKISIDLFFELVKSCELISNIITKR